jgi:cold shock CspA family protein
MQGVMSGVVFSKVPCRGFGFLIYKDCNEGQKIFFHATGLVGIDFESLDVGAEVDFLVAATPKGPQAYAIRLKCCV